MGYKPNIDATLYFYKNVFPLILDKKPQTKLKIVGGNPDNKIKNLNVNSNVEVTGYVEDIRNYLKQAMVSICTVKLNIGVQTKILESMAMGTPVVSTTSGNIGIEAIDKQDIIIEDNPTILANKIIQLLDGKGWNKQSVNGRKYVEKNFKWSISMKELDSLIKFNYNFKLKTR